MRSKSEGGDDYDVSVQVMFTKNYIRFGKKNIPLFRINYMQMAIPEIVSGSHLHVCGTGVRGCCCCWHAARRRPCELGVRAQDLGAC
jgi:hypothetical protein